MRKIIFVLTFIFCLTQMFALRTGVVNIGGSGSFSSYKHSSGSEATKTITLTPKVGYFFNNNFCGDFSLDFQNRSYDKESESSFGVGFGGRLFSEQNLYLGGNFIFRNYSKENDDFFLIPKSIYSYLQILGGKLFYLTDNVFFDIGASYDIEVKNESTQLNIFLGIEVYFRR